MWTRVTENKVGWTVATESTGHLGPRGKDETEGQRVSRLEFSRRQQNYCVIHHTSPWVESKGLPFVVWFIFCGLGKRGTSRFREGEEVRGK